MRFKCKKSYISLRKTMFEKGFWYDGNYNRDGKKYFYIKSNRGVNLTINYYGFNEYFHTVQEIREMEINKIIDGSI